MIYGRLMINEGDVAAGFELERRNYEANALVIEPRSSLHK